MEKLTIIMNEKEYLQRFVIKVENAFVIPREDKYGDLNTFISRTDFATKYSKNPDVRKENLLIGNIFRKAKELDGRLNHIVFGYPGLVVEISFSNESSLEQFHEYLIDETSSSLRMS